MVSAYVDCYTSGMANQVNCSAEADCVWRDEEWDSWCENRGCYQVFTQDACGQSSNSSSESFINKTCAWQSVSETGYCSYLSCWTFDGTNSSACVNNTDNLRCSWVDTYNPAEYNYPCMGPPEKQCWNLNTSSTCTAVQGCTWGACMQEDCWDYSSTNKTYCETQLGRRGNACEWDTQYSNCRESGCHSKTDSSTCSADGNCTWSGSYCNELSCGVYSWTNASNCENNTASLECQWNVTSSICTDITCNDYSTTGTCSANADCNWETYTGGYCSEVDCYTFGTNVTCESNTANLECVWGGNECYRNMSAKSCGIIQGQKDCFDTMYCFWNETSSACSDPSGDYFTDFEGWNPGCYLFDSRQAICENTTGCDWSAGDSECNTNLTVIASGQLNCSMITNNSICNSIPAFSSCCTWAGGECVEDKFTKACWDDMKEPPEGAYYCDDYNSYTDPTLCAQIAGDPWFMPCNWDSNTSRCIFKHDDVFGDKDKNIMAIDNKKNCEAAGGKWILDTYCEGNVAIPMGRCEFKFDEERNCDKECFACEYKTDKTNWASQADAKAACGASKSGICGFTEDSTAPNGYGYCKPKEEFKSGQAGDCKSDCGSCASMGDPTASEKFSGNTAQYETCIAPSCYCSNSPAKCKWLADPNKQTDEAAGVCVSKSEKTCQDQCDKCYDEGNCKNKGGKLGNATAAAVCEWSGSICQYKSGADSLEICWDGIDNNDDNKMDCADSMCFSDPFCGGEFMFSSFGVDCFGYDEETPCENEGCVWINETWGSRCDIPAAACWKLDGTNQTYCENNSITGVGTCEWHSGFGGMCEGNWNIGSACHGLNEVSCDGANALGCTWLVDDWCTEFGAICEPNDAYSGSWYKCWEHDMDGNATCRTSGTADGDGNYPCDWVPDPWCAQQGVNAGFCEHESFACMQYDDNQTACGLAGNCTWQVDSYGSFCEPSMGEDCKNQPNATECSDAGCNWMSGFCDPAGFGGEMMPGMSGGGGGGGGSGMTMGGSGMQCMQYNGNQTNCEAQTGCGWFDEPWPFCDINFASNCPQHSYNQTVCEGESLCMWNPDASFCDEKAFECMWNQTLQTDLAICDAHPLCVNATGYCEPAAFTVSTQAECDALNESFKWATGWCNPGMAAQFFQGMEMSGPPTPLGNDPLDNDIEAEVDILDFGMKDMGDAYGFGIGIRDMANAAACNNIKMQGGTGGGTNQTTYYWYFDTDSNQSNNCALNHDSNELGYEFYMKNGWVYDDQSGSVTESPSAYRCSEGSWIKAEISVSSVRQIMCSMIGGAMIAIDMDDLEKYTDMYDENADLRVTVASAGPSNNETDPSDSASAGYATPGSFDFSFDDLDMFKFETDGSKKAGKEGSSTGWIDYATDADCWTSSGCGDYACKAHPYCVNNSLGVEANNFVDSKTPMIIGISKEVYPDGAFIAYYTDKPANGTLKFYKNDSTCKATSLNVTIADVGVANSDVEAYKLWHTAEIDINNLGYNLDADTRYYYKVKICDQAGKCGESKCSSFRTETNTNCPFCKFVTRLKAPTGWEVKYDLNQDATYEHWQGNVCGDAAGMKTNYTNARRANILLTSTDNTSYIEFLDTRITKTGLNSKTSEIDSSGALQSGTTESTSGATVGYAGMAEATRDKIVNNLYPQKCLMKIPSEGTCEEFWHCNNDMTLCLNRTSEATLNVTGSDFCIWEVPYCQFSTWVGGQPGEAAAASSSSSGGGGGGGAIATATKTTSETRVWAEIKAGDKISMPVSKEEIPISQVEFTVENDKLGAEVKVSGLGEKPTSVSAASNKVYKYLEIAPKVITTDDVSSVKIDFKVPKTWVVENNIKKATIVLLRYVDDKWVELSTTSKGSDSTNYFFQAVSPGFSYFAISAEQSEVAQEVVVEKEAQQEEASTVEEETPAEAAEEEQESEGQKDVLKNTVIVLVVVALAILIPVFIVFFKKKKE